MSPAGEYAEFLVRQHNFAAAHGPWPRLDGNVFGVVYGKTTPQRPSGLSLACSGGSSHPCLRLRAKATKVIFLSGLSVSEAEKVLEAGL